MGTGARASTDINSQKSEPKWSWLTENDKTRLLNSIPPKPALGSELDNKDLATVLKFQAARTPQDIAEAFNDKKFRLEFVSAGVLSPNFTAENFPKSFALLIHVNQDESLLNSTLKKQNQRLRPFQSHPEVHALFSVDQYSYPSGHASGSTVLAAILGELFPDKKEALLARAEAVCRSRVIAGVHYPSDIEEGKKLGRALVDALLANPDFQKDLAAARSELADRKNLL